MAQTRTPYPLRLPEQLREWMQQQADANSRSLQGELIHRLQQSKANEEAKHAKH
jgi:hypothetical protein